MVWLACVTLNVWSTGVAGAKLAFPACDASIVHVPAVTSVTVIAFELLETVHTDEVLETNATARFDVALALTVKAGDPKTLSVRAANAIVWLCGFTLKVCVTGVAAA
jgi:hypothetical protein